MTKPHIGMVLAAGKGTRLHPLTANMPKSLVQLAGKPFISYAIEQMIIAGIKQIIVNTHYYAEQVHTYLGTCPYRDKVKFIISDEEELLGTGGGIWNAMQQFPQESILFMNSDVIFSQSVLSSLMEAWQEHMHGLLLLKDVRDVNYSVEGDYDLSADYKLVKGKDYIYTGAGILSPKLFNHCQVEFLAYIDLINNNENCYGITTNAKWFDLGTIDRLNKAEEFVMAG